MKKTVLPLCCLAVFTLLRCHKEPAAPPAPPPFDPYDIQSDQIVWRHALQGTSGFGYPSIVLPHDDFIAYMDLGCLFNLDEATGKEIDRACSNGGWPEDFHRNAAYCACLWTGDKIKIFRLGNGAGLVRELQAGKSFYDGSDGYYWSAMKGADKHLFFDLDNNLNNGGRYVAHYDLETGTQDSVPVLAFKARVVGACLDANGHAIVHYKTHAHSDTVAFDFTAGQAVAPADVVVARSSAVSVRLAQKVYRMYSPAGGSLLCSIPQMLPDSGSKAITYRARLFQDKLFFQFANGRAGVWDATSGTLVWERTDFNVINAPYFIDPPDAMVFEDKLFGTVGQRVIGLDLATGATVFESDLFGKINVSAKPKVVGVETGRLYINIGENLFCIKM